MRTFVILRPIHRPLMTAHTIGVLPQPCVEVGASCSFRGFIVPRRSIALGAIPAQVLGAVQCFQFGDLTSKKRSSPRDQSNLLRNYIILKARVKGELSQHLSHLG
jgi:hypothetical protein